MESLVSLECLDAPFPYIIGVSRKVWEDHCVMREFPDDVIIFDIDNQERLNWVREELPQLPQPQANILERGLRDVLEMRERFTKDVYLPIINDDQTPLIDKVDEYYWAYA